MNLMRLMFRAIFKKYWKTLFLIAVISAVGCGVMSGMNSATMSLDNTLQEYIDGYGAPDATITTAITKRDRRLDLLALEDVAEADTRLMANTVLCGPSGRYFSVRAMSYDDADFQKFFYWDKAETDAMDSVYLEYNFAHANGISAGDTVSVRVGKEYRDYFVAGVVSMVETLNVMPIDGMRSYSTDFGYLYASRSLLAKEVNQEYEDGLTAWNEKRLELTDAEGDAQTQYKNALAELEKAESELNEKKAEFAEKRPELEEQRAELTQTKDDLLRQSQEALLQRAELEERQAELIEKQRELTEQQRELDEKKAEAESQQIELEEQRAEAESQQNELNQKKAEADEKKAELDESQAQLDEKLAELNEAEETLKEQRQQVWEGHREVTRQLIALQKTRQQLRDGQLEIETGRAKAIEQRADLLDARAELTAKRTEVQEQLNRLRQAQRYLLQVESAVSAVSEVAGIRERVQAAIEEIDRTISDLEAMQRRLEQAQIALTALDAAISAAEAAGLNTVEMLAKRQEIVDQLAEYGVLPDQIDSAIAQTKATINELRNRRAELIRQIEELEDPDVLQERADFLRDQLDALMSGVGERGSISEYVLNEYIDQAESGLAQIDDGLYQIEDGLWQIREGLALADEKEAEIRDGLAQIEEGEPLLREALRQMEEALPQMDDGLRKMWEGRLEIADYQAQIDEGRAQLEDGYSQIAEYQAQLDEGFTKIAEYDKQLADGFSQIAEYQAQIDEGAAQIADYQSQIDDGFSQIAEGLAQLTDGLAQIDEGLNQIDEAVAEAERQLAEGEEQLNSKRAEAEAAWIDAMTQFDDLEQELKDAWAELSDWEGYDALCNQFLLKFSPGADPEKTLEAAKAALGDIEIKSAVLYADSGVMSRINNFVKPIGQMAAYLPAILFAVALVVVFLFISLMVRQCRREIGILRALGFSKGRVRLLFCYIAFIASLFACVLGLGIGIGLAWFLGYCFAPIFPLPFFHYGFNAVNYGFACALTILVCQASMILGTNLIGRVHPAEAMTRPAPANAKIPALFRGLMKRAAPFSKFSLSSLLRNKMRFLYSSFCLACTVMLIFASIAYVFSKEKLIEDNYGQRIRYDCQIFFTQYPDEGTLDEMAALDGVSGIQRLAFYSVELAYGQQKEKTFLNALEDGSGMIGIYDEKQKALHLPREGIVLEKHLAEKFGVKTGDSVTADGVPLEVKAISSQTMSYVHYISFAQAEALGDPYMEVVLCRVDAAHENELVSFLKDHDDYVFSIFTRVARETVDQMFSSYDAMTYLLVAMASVLGMVIIVTTSKSNLLEQKRELCVLRTLGFQHSQISRHWFLQSLLQFLVSCGAGLLAGRSVEKEALARMSDASREFPMVSEPWLYVATLTVVLAYVILSHFISMRSVKQWDLVESVKDKE